MACIAVVLLGLVSYGGLSVDLLPDVSTPRITLMTRAEGLSPVEVERLVTQPLERAAAGVPGLERTTSVSREGMSVITLAFPWGIDLDLAALHVRERVDAAAATLSRQADRPAVLRWDPGSEPVMGVAVGGGSSPGELRELVETAVVTRLEQVVGIAGGQVTGGAQREIHVELDPEKLTTYGLTVSEVMGAIERSNRSARSGTVLQGAFRYSVQVLGQFRSVDDIAGVPVDRGPEVTLLTVGDLGEVVEGTRPRLAGALLDGQPAVGVLLYKESGVNTIEAVEAAEEALRELQDEHPELALKVAFENASFIRDAIDSVVQNIVIGGLLAFAVLFLFLKDPRNPILLGLSIPVSLIATFVLCYFTGISLNIMTLGGLALGVGMLVDNSIVVLENIFRHRQLGADAEEAARRGTDEVALAVSAATLTTIAVFLPIAYVHGVAGELFSPQAWTVAFALLASLLVSLTVLPMLAARFLRFGDFTRRVVASPPRQPAGAATVEDPAAGSPSTRPDGAESVSQASGDEDGGPTDHRIERAVRAASRGAGRALTALVALPLFWIRGLGWITGLLLDPVIEAFGRFYDGTVRLYHSCLRWCLRHRVLTLLGCLALVGLGAFVALSMPFELMPPVTSGRFDITLDAPPGTPFDELERMVGRLDAAVRAEQGVGTTFATLGLETSTAPGAASGVMALSPTRAFLTVVMEGGRSRTGAARMQAAMAAARREARSMEGVTLTVDPQRSPLERLLGAEASGFRIAVRGDDLDVLDRLADEAAARLAPVSGLEDVMAHNSRGNPEIVLRVKRDAARRYQVDVDELTDAIVGALQGRIAATEFVEFDRRLDIRVSARRGLAGVAEVLDRPYPTESGQVPLRELVEQSVGTGPSEIVRTDRVREIPITATLSGVALSEAVEAAEAALSGVEFPPGYRYRVAGERREVDASFRSLGWALALAGLLVYMVMAAQFESLRHPLVILLSLPLGWTGVVFALWATGISLNVVALVGAVVLTGIIVNDAIVKVDTINRLRRDNGYLRRRAVIEGSGLRLRPILMTSVTTAFALIPMALGLGAAAELQRPLAVAVIGGESTGTLLTLLVIPVFYELLDRDEAAPATTEGADADAQEASTPERIVPGDLAGR